MGAWIGDFVRRRSNGPNRVRLEVWRPGSEAPARAERRLETRSPTALWLGYNLG